MNADLKTVKSLVEKYLDIPDIGIRTRQIDVCYARYIYYLLSREIIKDPRRKNCKIPLKSIADYLGMNHASVIHHLKHAPYTIPQDPELQIWYDYITAYLNELVHAKSIDSSETAGVDTMNVLEKVELLLEKVQNLELEIEGLKDTL